MSFIHIDLSLKEMLLTGNFLGFTLIFFLPGYTKCIDISEGNSVMPDVGFSTGKMVQSLIKDLIVV